MTTIMRIAKAIYEGRNGKGATPFERLTRSHQSPYVEDALAALKILREPSVAMQESAQEAYDEGYGQATMDEVIRAAMNEAISYYERWWE